MVLMGLPGKYFPTVVNFWEWIGPDKIIHSLLFGLLSFLYLWGYRNNILSKNKSYQKKAFLLSFILTVTYGGLTELLQKYVFINRYGSILDFYADAIGCILGIIVFFFCYKKKLKK
jgi:VanZ family protein